MQFNLGELHFFSLENKKQGKEWKPGEKEKHLEQSL